MKTFLEWLVERQMMMFSTKPVELYHGSNTGADNSALQSFKTKGVLPDVAKGYGQGQGFYVWSDWESAARHTKAIKDDSITTKARQDGLPMIVTIKSIIEPSEWDFDYENNHKKLIDWMYDNFDKIKGIVDEEGQTRLRNRWQREVLNAKDNLVMSKGIQFERPGGGWTSRYSNSGDSQSTDTGEMIGSIMNRLQQRDPETVHRFEEIFFANMGRGIPIKYVGSQPLKPEKIEVLKDGRWVEA